MRNMSRDNQRISIKLPEDETVLLLGVDGIERGVRYHY